MPDGPPKKRRGPVRLSDSDDRFIGSEEQKAAYAAEMYSSSAEETVIGVTSMSMRRLSEVEGKVEPDIAEEADTAAGEETAPQEKEEDEQADAKELPEEKDEDVHQEDVK